MEGCETLAVLCCLLRCRYMLDGDAYQIKNGYYAGALSS